MMNNQYSGTAVGDVKLFYNENAGTQSPSPAVPALPGFTGLTGRRPGSTRVRSPAAARVGLALPRGSHAWYTLPCLALPSLALPHLALPCLTLPCLALPCLALPCLTLGTALNVNQFYGIELCGKQPTTAVNLFAHQALARPAQPDQAQGDLLPRPSSLNWQICSGWPAILAGRPHRPCFPAQASRATSWAPCGRAWGC